MPQTRALPAATTRAFRREMAFLWRGITRDRVRLAMLAFFPQSAYLQVKAVSDPAGDWRDRLVGEYALDIAAAHGLIGPDARRARLLRVVVPNGNAHWVPPGVCLNRVGYWETPNSRLVYRAAGPGGGVRSLGIASLISWRGVWYVVHLGAVVRPAGGGGAVDDPSAGPGYAAPSSTC